jgi:hypothetical protein
MPEAPICLICNEGLTEDLIEGLGHESEPDDHHRPKVRSPFPALQDPNQAATRIVREATGD